MSLKNKMIIAGAAVVLCGLLFGIFRRLPGEADFEPYVSVLVKGQTTLLGAAVPTTAFVAAVFFLGYFLPGFVLVYPLLFFRAFAAGLTARLCLEIYGTYGVYYILAYVLPVSAITLLLMTLLAAQSFTFSVDSIFGGERSTALNRLLHHTVFGLTFVLMSGFACVWSAFLNPIIAKVI